MPITHLAATAAAFVLSMLSACHAQPEISDPLPPPRATGELRVIDYRMEKDGREYAWSVMIPPGVAEGGPGLLFLHGYGECGTDGKKNLAVGLPPAVRKNPERWPMVIIVPQKPVHASEWEDHEAALLAMLDEAAQKGHYDPERLAITGLSQGGHGTIAMATRHTARFKAAAPVCGYVDRRFDDQNQRLTEGGATPADAGVVAAAEAMSGLPVWLFHGTLDDVVPPSESRSLFAALEKHEHQARYTELPDANHNSWDAAYADPELASWLVRHTR